MKPERALPPQWAERTLEWAAGHLQTRDLVVDAHELFSRKAEHEGERAARHWYRRQVRAAVKSVVLGWVWPRGGVSAAFSALDFKLGLRMLFRSPGLTVVAGLAMAFAIAVGAGTFEFARDALYPRLPLDEGDRVVRFQETDARIGGRRAIAQIDFVAWRESLESLREVGAFHGIARALATGEGSPLPVDGVAVTASAFSVARVKPLLGRALMATDESPGATPVTVLGYDLWRTGFGSDPGVVGRVIRLGDEATTVVGVMPEDFGFPAPADIYVPLRLERMNAAAPGRPGSKPVIGFGRLDDQATIEQAQAELVAIAARTPVAAPVERAQVTPTVEPFAHAIVSTDALMTNVIFGLTAFFLTMLMIVVCANVALLLFARVATREGEITVRTALGASRGRIVVQLFVEALVLAGVSALVGLWLASMGLKTAMNMANAAYAFPFWIGDTLSLVTVGWATLLSLLGATVAGVIPALQVTGQQLSARLQQGSGRGSVVRMSGLWTGIVVGQVALTVIFMPLVFVIGSFYFRVRSAETAVAAEEYLVADLEIDGTPGKAAAVLEELRSTLIAQSWVRGLSLSDGEWPHWSDRAIEIAEVPSSDVPINERRSQQMAVEPGFFDVIGARLISGRVLTAADVSAEQRAVVVNEAFVQEVLGGRNAVGRRISLTDPPAGTPDLAEESQQKWYEIVGVIGDLGMNPFSELPHQGVIYQPLPAQAAARLSLIIRVTGEPASLITRLRVIALQVDSNLRLLDPQALSYRMDRPEREYSAWFKVVAAAGAIALLLTLAGIYAVMAFTVARRTREIGVRVALGATRRQVATGILSRAVLQVGYGVLIGGALIPLIVVAMARLVDEPGSVGLPKIVIGALLIAYMAVMMAACLTACIVPLRRALRVQPTIALASDA